MTPKDTFASLARALGALASYSGRRPGRRARLERRLAEAEAQHRRAMGGAS